MMKASDAQNPYALIIIGNMAQELNRENIQYLRTIYGPEDGRVVTNFIIQALKQKDITVYGDGSQTRSFCYVDDMVEGLIRMMGTDDDFTGPINLGNPQEFTISEFAEKVIDKTESSSNIINCPLPHDDPTKRKPDISLAKEALNWEPKVMLDEGLDKTIEYYKGII